MLPTPTTPTHQPAITTLIAVALVPGSLSPDHNLYLKLNKNGRREPSVFCLQVSCTSRVQSIPQAIPHKVDTQHRYQYQQAGEEPQPRCALNVFHRTIQHIAPACRGSLNAEAQKADISLIQNGGRDAQRGRDGNGRKGIRQKRTEDDESVGDAQGTGSRNEVQLLEREHVGAHDPCQIHPTGKTDHKNNNDHTSGEGTSENFNLRYFSTEGL